MSIFVRFSTPKCQAQQFFTQPRRSGDVFNVLGFGAVNAPDDLWHDRLGNQEALHLVALDGLQEIEGLLILNTLCADGNPQVMGMLQVMLYDLRTDSPTFGRLNTLYAGVVRPLQIRIPPGVGHGYKVLGTEAALLVYATDRFYDPSDEGRLPWNDSDINYDWETQRK